VRVTVIAAGFDGGVPTRRQDERALGQITGSSSSGRQAQAPAAAGSASNGATYGGAQYTASTQRPYSGNEPAAPASAPRIEQPARTEPAVSRETGEPQRREEPVVVPDSLEPVRVRAPRSVVFDDVDDELDVPDFLK